MRGIIAFFALLLTASASLAAYPEKPVRLIVSFGPGGASDIQARLIANALSRQLGQQFIVENRAGGGGIVGDQYVAKAAPDGYTILMVDVTFAIAPGLHKTLPFDVIKDFTPITELSSEPNAVVVSPALKINTLAEFIALAREKPGKVFFGTGGVGTPGHLAGELLKMSAKINITHVPYKGGGELMPALLSGQVQMVLPPLPAVLGAVQGGQAKALVITTNGPRSPGLPDVPTAKEAGLPDMAVLAWFGLVGPPGLPAAIADKLQGEVVKAFKDADVRKQFAGQGADTVGSTPQEFGALIRSEAARWNDVINKAGIPKVD